MSGIPKEIPDLGSIAQRPRQNPQFSPSGEFSAEDYYVWTRCDGHTSLKEIILMVGLGFDRGAEILAKLRRSGAILFDGESPESVTSSAGSSRRRRRPTSTSEEPPPEQPVFAGVSTELGELSEEEEAALAEEVALGEEEKRRILAVMRQIRDADYFQVLGVGPGAGKRELKRAYFRISKEFHPDRYYGQHLGPFGEWLSKIFETATRAFDTLSDRKQRQAYEARLRGEAPASGQARSQSPEEHAADLFQRACDLEVRSETEEALKLFAAVSRLAPRPRYLWRAAVCAKNAGKLSDAAEYAKKAADLRPDDPSYLRVVADVHRAADRLQEAEDTLLRALELDTDNDKLLAELKSDLDAVRRARGVQ